MSIGGDLVTIGASAVGAMAVAMASRGSSHAAHDQTAVNAMSEMLDEMRTEREQLRRRDTEREAEVRERDERRDRIVRAAVRHVTAVSRWAGDLATRLRAHGETDIPDPPARPDELIGVGLDE